MSVPFGDAARWVGARTRTRWLPWAVLGVVAVLALPVSLLAILATWLEYRDSPPTCYGIGFGCSLAPTDAGAFAAIFWFIGLSYVVGPLLLTELFWRRVALLRSIVALVTLAAAVLLAGWLVAVTVAAI